MRSLLWDWFDDCITIHDPPPDKSRISLSSTQYRNDSEEFFIQPLLKGSTEKPEFGKAGKKRLSEDQIRLLETNFSFNKKLDQDLKYHLSQQLNLPPRQVAIWYQNKRARWKSQTLESDHKAMQLKLDNALANNRKLEREVQRLQRELDKVRAVLLTSPSIPYSSAVSTSGDEDGGSSFLGRSECGLDSEFYACLAGVENDHQYHSAAGFSGFGLSM